MHQRIVPSSHEVTSIRYAIGVPQPNSFHALLDSRWQDAALPMLTVQDATWKGRGVNQH